MASTEIGRKLTGRAVSVKVGFNGTKGVTGLDRVRAMGERDETGLESGAWNLDPCVPSHAFVLHV